MADVNGNLLVTFSVPLALIPYLLRSIRIKKMFESRDEYCETDKIPRKSIIRWSEERVIKILIMMIGAVTIGNLTLKWTGHPIPSYNSISGNMKYTQKGLFPLTEDFKDD